MMRGKTIRQFLIDGEANGRWTTELSNWTGKAYKIPRTYINQCWDRDDLNNTGVYFLFGRDDETDAEQVYIGEAENILSRLKQHLSGKDFWTECIVFVSKDNNLNKAHIKYLEHHLYIMVKEAKKCELINNAVPTESSISEMDRAEMDEFIDNMRLVLGVLGHKILDFSVNNKKDEKTPLFTLQDRSGVRATSRPISEGFAVLKGSKIAMEVAPSLSKSVLDKRQSLIDKGVIDENFTFTEDWSFSSPSLAAAIIVGYSINGRLAWKDKRGVPFKDVESEN
ncbi:MAG: GIY-YIG nuclease family protein [Lachnospiraceae bacterium]|nr:GIY-YIG nuclease family protein [Lachnospiraceae bacterium]